MGVINTSGACAFPLRSHRGINAVRHAFPGGQGGLR